MAQVTDAAVDPSRLANSGLPKQQNVDVSATILVRLLITTTTTADFLSRKCYFLEDLISFVEISFLHDGLCVLPAGYFSRDALYELLFYTLHQ